MALRHIYFPVKIVIVVAFLSIANNPLYAQYYTATPPLSTDTSGKYLSDPVEIIKIPADNSHLSGAVPSFDLHSNTLQQTLQQTISKPQGRKDLMAYLRQLDVTDDKASNTAHKKLFYGLANTFARLKLYPLAMKCFFKTLDRDNTNSNLSPPSIQVPPDSISDDTTDFDPGYLNFNSKDDTLLQNQPDLLIPKGQQLHKSPPINYQRIVKTFNDGKKAVAYAMLIHVKQPIPGKRKVYLFTNSGHTYITLIKYNSDSTYVSLSFGFYPKKNHPLAGTPLFPTAGSTYRNDANYKWDEIAGKFISKRRFDRILSLTKKYDGLKYHLSTNNCTDFSLKAAVMADINIKGTEGKWPLGHGNNPGVTGQSMLLGRVYNGPDTSQENLFIDHDSTISIEDK